jgi:ribosome-associated heat shock protein Hsp15
MNGEARQRIDKWLVYARVVKSRAQAARLVGAGHVRVNRDKIADPAYGVKPGDVLTIALDHGVLVRRVTGLGARRGPPAEARLLYEELGPASASPSAGGVEAGGGA